MPTLGSNPTFVAYAISLLALSANLLFLWGYSGGVRARTKTTPNREDAGGRAALEPQDPPDVARVLRAYANASAAVLPYAALGLVYTLAGGPATPAIVLFGAFTIARLGHSVAYLRALQPWRTISFAVGVASTVALMGFIVRTLVAA